MMKQQQQKKDILERLAEISPSWAMALSKKRDDEENGKLCVPAEYNSMSDMFKNKDGIRKRYRGFIDIQHCHRCIVGEAHGFSDEYVNPISGKYGYCMDCNNHSLLLCGVVPSEGYECPSGIDFEFELERFVDHFEAVHQKQ